MKANKKANTVVSLANHTHVATHVKLGDLTKEAQDCSIEQAAEKIMAVDFAEDTAVDFAISLRLRCTYESEVISLVATLWKEVVKRFESLGEKPNSHTFGRIMDRAGFSWDVFRPGFRKGWEALNPNKDWDKGGKQLLNGVRTAVFFPKAEKGSGGRKPLTAVDRVLQAIAANKDGFTKAQATRIINALAKNTSK